MDEGGGICAPETCEAQDDDEPTSLNFNNLPIEVSFFFEVSFFYYCIKGILSLWHLANFFMIQTYETVEKTSTKLTICTRVCVM